MNEYYKKKIYNNDIKKTIIRDNKEFLNWYYDLIKNGYYSVLSLDSIQSLIDRIARWYYIKYPDRQLLAYKNLSLEYIESNFKYLTIDQLRYDLSDDILGFLDGKYMYSDVEIRNIKLFCNSGDKVFERNAYKSYGIFSIWRKSDGDSLEKIIFSADENGIVDNSDLERLEPIIGKNINIVNLEFLFLKLEMMEGNDWNYESLKECLKFNKLKFKLRDKILNLVVMAIIYNDNTTVELGIIRANKFISEFNEYYGLGMNLVSFEEIVNNNVLLKVRKKLT